AKPQACVLIRPKKAPELGVVITWHALKPTGEVTPQHRDAAEQRWMCGQAIQCHGEIVHWRSSHVVLAKPSSNAPCPYAVLASTLRTQVNEAQRLDIHTFSDPAQHAGAMAVDAIPHDLPDEASDLFEAGYPIELSHSDRHLVPAHLRYQGPAARVNK